MPYAVRPYPGHEGRFHVINTETGHVVNPGGRPLTHDVATKQFRVREGKEHGWEPTGKPSDLDNKDHEADRGAG